MYLHVMSCTWGLCEIYMVYWFSFNKSVCEDHMIQIFMCTSPLPPHASHFSHVASISRALVTLSVVIVCLVTFDVMKCVVWSCHLPRFVSHFMCTTPAQWMYFVKVSNPIVQYFIQQSLYDDPFEALAFAEDTHHCIVNWPWNGVVSSRSTIGCKQDKVGQKNVPVY